jgi:hypothetical protein
MSATVDVDLVWPAATSARRMWLAFSSLRFALPHLGEFGPKLTRRGPRLDRSLLRATVPGRVDGFKASARPVGHPGAEILAKRLEFVEHRPSWCGRLPSA